MVGMVPLVTMVAMVAMVPTVTMVAVVAVAMAVTVQGRPPEIFGHVFGSDGKRFRIDQSRSVFKSCFI